MNVNKIILEIRAGAGRLKILGEPRSCFPIYNQFIKVFLLV